MYMITITIKSLIFNIFIAFFMRIKSITPNEGLATGAYIRRLHMKLLMLL